MKEVRLDDRIARQVKKLYAKYPGLELMQTYSSRNLSLVEAMEPKACIIAMINMQLKSVVEDGKRIVFKVSG